MTYQRQDILKGMTDEGPLQSHVGQPPKGWKSLMATGVGRDRKDYTIKGR